MNEKKAFLEELVSYEKRHYRFHFILSVIYGIAICSILVWGIWFFWNFGISSLLWAFFVLPALAGIGIGLEINQLYKKRNVIKELEFYLNTDTLTEADSQKIDRICDETPEDDSVKTATYRILYSLLTGVLMVSVSHLSKSIIFSPKDTTEKNETYIPAVPTDIDLWKFDEMVEHRAVSGSDQLYVDRPAHKKAKKWMKNLQILPEVLYEDGQFKLEITGYKIKRSDLYIYMRFTNKTDYTVNARAETDSVCLNRRKSSSVYITPGRSTEPGETEESSFCISSFEIPWYDHIFEELKFSLEVTNADAESTNDENYMLLKTNPLYIRPVPEDGKETAREPAGADDGDAGVDDGVDDDGVRPLFENDVLKVFSTGIYEKLLLKNNVPNMMSRTYWEILIDNKTDRDVTITDVKCFVNGRNALLTDDEAEVFYTVMPGMRDTVMVNLYGAVPDEEAQTEKITSLMELMQKIRWPLDRIKEASLDFTVNYMDSSGQMQSAPVHDDFTGFTGETAENATEMESNE